MTFFTFVLVRYFLIVSHLLTHQHKKNIWKRHWWQHGKILKLAYQEVQWKKITFFICEEWRLLTTYKRRRSEVKYLKLFSSINIRDILICFHLSILWYSSYIMYKVCCVHVLYSFSVFIIFFVLLIKFVFISFIRCCSSHSHSTMRWIIYQISFICEYTQSQKKETEKNEMRI